MARAPTEGCPITKLDTFVSNQTVIPFMVRYLTTNGKFDYYRVLGSFALRYRRAEARGGIPVVGETPEGIA